MRSTPRVLALALLLLPGSELQAQPLPYPVPLYGGYGYGGYGYGGGVVGFSYQRRHLSISGFLGGFGVSRYGGGAVYLSDPYGPVYGSPYGPAPIIIENRINLQLGGEPKSFKRALTLEEETRGEDLDLKSPQKGLPPPEWAALPKAPANLPGQDVSKPKPTVRPEDQPPKIKPPPPKMEDLPKQPPPPDVPLPEADPRKENARLVKLGLAAFRGQEYVLATLRFRQATLVQPKSAPAYFFLAQAQFALGKYRPAVDAIHAGMALTKNWPKAPFQPRGDLYKGTEADFVAHLKRLQAALAKSPADPAYLFLTAYQLWFDGRQLEAVPLFQQARAVTADRRFIDQFLAAAAPGPVAAN